jgi:hypothetical protein
MITEEESREYFIQIRLLLLQSKLNWIVPQVEEEIASGRLASKPLKEISLRQTSMFEVVSETKPQRSSKENVSTSEAYTFKEQLAILLNALEEISDIYLLKSETLLLLKGFNENVTSVQFVSPHSDTAESPTNAVLRNEDNDFDTFQKLKEIIGQIKQEI